VFIGTLAMLHVIQLSRGKAVATAWLGAIRPEVWVSGLLGRQHGHGALWQMCLAQEGHYFSACGVKPCGRGQPRARSAPVVFRENAIKPLLAAAGRLTLELAAVPCHHPPTQR